MDEYNTDDIEFTVNNEIVNHPVGEKDEELCDDCGYPTTNDLIINKAVTRCVCDDIKERLTEDDD